MIYPLFFGIVHPPTHPSTGGFVLNRGGLKNTHACIYPYVGVPTTGGPFLT